MWVCTGDYALPLSQTYWLQFLCGVLTVGAGECTGGYGSRGEQDEVYEEEPDQEQEAHQEVGQASIAKIGGFEKEV